MLENMAGTNAICQCMVLRSRFELNYNKDTLQGNLIRWYGPLLSPTLWLQHVLIIISLSMRVGKCMLKHICEVWNEHHHARLCSTIWPRLVVFPPKLSPESNISPPYRPRPTLINRLFGFYHQSRVNKYLGPCHFIDSDFKIPCYSYE